MGCDRLTNEELAEQIQGGNKQLIPELWERVKRLMFKLSYAYYKQHIDRCAFAGVALEDLQQESFCAFMNAVYAFKPDGGFRFLSYIKLPLLTCFNSLLGIRGRKEPINEAVSLDAPLPGTEESMTLGDTLKDQDAAIDYDDAERRIYCQELHEAMEKSLETLDQQQRLIIREYWYKGKGCAAIGAQIGLSRHVVRNVENKAMRSLRKPRSVKYLKPFADEYIKSHAYIGTSFTAFKYNGASIEERIVEHLEF